MKKKTLSVRSINEILGMIEPKERLAFNEEYIEGLYLEYQRNDINDTSARQELGKELAGKKILIVGPGKSVISKREVIDSYIKDEKPLIMSINTDFDGIDSDYIFLSNSKRYMQLSSSLERLRKNGLKVIATSNVTSARGSFDRVMDYSSLIDEDCPIPDNSLPMLLRLLSDIGVDRIALAGFDGYSEKARVNYYNEDMEYDFAHNYALELNEYTAKVIHDMTKNGTKIIFVTESKYEQY